MKIGIPQGLLYPKYHVFARTFLEGLGAQVVLSPDTNKAILDEGVRLCVDDACLPMKIFHGHVAWLRGRCDAMLIPRFISLRERQYICPMFCGLIEMLRHNIPGLPPLIDTPVYSLERSRLWEWARQAGGAVTRDEARIMAALALALSRQRAAAPGFYDEGYPLTVGLIGHAYNIFDPFVNMNLKAKLNALGVGAVTLECVDRADIDAEVAKLFKPPFWCFARDYYGAAATMRKTGRADGVVYLSSFSCGIDSVVTELIKHELGDFPFMVLKLDEHTGNAGFDTRIEAFADLLKRRCAIGRHLS